MTEYLYFEDNIMRHVKGEIEWLTYLGNSFEDAVAITRRHLIDTVDASLIMTGLLRDFERNQEKDRG
jgi:hypothetical protein